MPVTIETIKSLLLSDDKGGPHPAFPLNLTVTDSPRFSKHRVFFTKVVALEMPCGCIVTTTEGQIDITYSELGPLTMTSVYVPNVRVAKDPDKDGFYTVVCEKL